MNVYIYIKGHSSPIVTKMDNEDLHDTLELLYQSNAKCLWIIGAFIYTSSIDYITWENT